MKSLSIKFKNFIIVQLILVFIFLLNYDLNAQGISYNQEFRINTNIDYGDLTPQVTELAGGGFVVCWESRWQDDAGAVFAQIFDAEANKIGEEFQVSPSPSSFYMDPAICALASGGFVICWVHWDIVSDLKIRVFGQVFTENGERIGEIFDTDSETSYWNSNPSISGLSGGGFVILWSSQIVGGSLKGIYGQIFYKNGSKIGEKFLLAENGEEIYMSSPAVSALTGGGFIICWYKGSSNGSVQEINGQLFNEFGNKIGGTFLINSNRPQNPAVSGLTDSSFVACWETIFNVNYGKIWGQIFNKNGKKLCEEFQVNTYTSDFPKFPRVSGISEGCFIICWGSYEQDGSAGGIYAQMFDKNGYRVGTEFQVNSYTPEHQWSPSACALADTGFVICWEGYGEIGTTPGIFGKYYFWPVRHQFQQFSLLEPAYDSIVSTLEVTFKWSSVDHVRLNFPWEIEYQLYLDESEDFLNPAILQIYNDTTCNINSLMPGKTYFWKVLVKDYAGDSLWSSETFGFYFSPAAQIDVDRNNRPSAFELFPNYPNPFNPQTTIRYNLPENQSDFSVVIKIYDVLGRSIITLRNEKQHPGIYSLTWDGRDASGRLLPSGIYFCQLSAGSYIATQKMLSVR